MAQNKAKEEPKHLRIVLLGKTGVGKSAVGNTILGRVEYKSYLTANSLTQECQKEKVNIKGRDVYVVDTPGLFDTDKIPVETVTEIKRCISLASPGPHAFLVVIQLGTFTKEDHDTVELIKAIFGDESNKYTMVLFSHGDQLGNVTIEDFVKGNEDLKHFTAQCLGGYHVFNNKVQNRKQVEKLLQKIDDMVAEHGGGYYSTEMFKQVEKEIERQTKENLKKDKEKNEEKAREKAEYDNKFIRGGVILGAIGGGIGGAVIGGPVGAAVGAAGGAAVGAGVGWKCTIQ